MKWEPPTGGISKDAPIGMFDSGLGGLSVVRQLGAYLPHERVIYVADQAHVPYGGRDLAEVEAFAIGITDGLVRSGCKAIVMACNISTATALEAAHVRYPDLLVLGVIEPGVLEALSATQNGKVGVLATEGTRRSGAYSRLLHLHSSSIFVLEVGCPRFVPLVEAGEESSVEAMEACQEYLAPLLEVDVDTVILGCTHYPFLLPLLTRIAPHLRFIDPAVSTIELLRQRLIGSDLLVDAPASLVAGSFLSTTGDPSLFREQVGRFLPHSFLNSPNNPVGGTCITSACWNSDALELHLPALVTT